MESRHFWNRLKTIFFGKFVGKDHLGNKYYESKNGKRWVIYSSEIDASKIPVEWYSWIHFTPNRIEKTHDLKKYEWQKPHQPNLPELKLLIIQTRIKKMLLKKNIKVGKINKSLFIIFLYLIIFSSFAIEANNNLEGKILILKY